VYFCTSVYRDQQPTIWDLALTEAAKHSQCMNTLLSLVWFVSVYLNVLLLNSQYNNFSKLWSFVVNHEFVTPACHAVSVSGCMSENCSNCSQI